SRITHPTSNVAISLVVPFFAYLPAERLDASGLVAAVVAGLVTGHGSARYLRPQDRLTTEAVWRTLEMLLESAIFLLMGLELYGLIAEVHDEHGSVRNAVLLGALGAVLVIIIRGIFVAPSLWLLHRRGRRNPVVRERIATIRDQLESRDLQRLPRLPRMDEDEVRERVSRRSERMSSELTRRLADLDYLSAQSFGWREGVVLVWAGMRGAVTLAAAQSLPADTPQRALLILIAFVVAAGTLIIQGGTLGWLVGILGLTRKDPAEHQAQLFELRRELAQVLTDRLERTDLIKADGTPFSPVSVNWARRIIESLMTADEQRGADGEDLRTERGQLRLALIELQRAELLRIRDLGTYPSSVLEDTLTQLDADQLSLELRTVS
ncbi:MAG TPA: cation:proton antiporter, partial [Microlunatus sp.]|nr:cation:proton antiporter [Microlunatus sp.]